MEEGLKKLYSGDFNTMVQRSKPDGSVIITLSKRGDKSYKFRVMDLYGEHEKVLEEEVIDTKAKAPPWTKKRMEEAKKWKEERGKK